MGPIEGARRIGRDEDLPRIAVVLAALALGVGAAAAWEATAAGAERIDVYTIRIDVDPDGTLLVREEIAYDFGTEQRHGIFRDLVTRQGYDDTHDRVYCLDAIAVTVTPEGTRGRTRTETTCILQAMADLNWYAILAAGAAYFALGAPWFAPRVFGDAWARAIGFKRPDPWTPGVALYAVPLLARIAAALATAILARATGTATIVDGVALGLVVALGYSVAIAGVDAVSPDNPGPLPLFLITGAYHLVGLIVATTISPTRWYAPRRAAVLAPTRIAWRVPRAEPRPRRTREAVR